LKGNSETIKELEKVSGESFNLKGNHNSCKEFVIPSKKLALIPGNDSFSAIF
jgi:hypothetical protein